MFNFFLSYFQLLGGFLGSRLIKNMFINLLVFCVLKYLKFVILSKIKDKDYIQHIVNWLSSIVLMLTVRYTFDEEVNFIREKLISLIVFLVNEYIHKKYKDPSLLSDLKNTTMLKLVKDSPLKNTPELLEKASSIKLVVPKDLYLLREDSCFSPLCKKLLTQSVEFKNRLISYMVDFNSLVNVKMSKILSVQSTEMVLTKVLQNTRGLTSKIRMIPKEDLQRVLYLKDLQFILLNCKDNQDMIKYFTPEMHKNFREQFIPQILYLITKVDEDLSFYILFLQKK
jgi:branched-subunit amino acid transport protein AzlD